MNQYLLLGYNASDLEALYHAESVSEVHRQIAQEIMYGSRGVRIITKIYGESTEELTDGQIIDMMVDCKFQVALISVTDYFSISNFVYKEFLRALERNLAIAKHHEFDVKRLELMLADLIQSIKDKII
jgi:hypothetical protein